MAPESLKEREEKGDRNRFQVPRPRRNSGPVKQNSKRSPDVSTSPGHGLRLQPLLALAIPWVPSMRTLIPILTHGDTGTLG